MYRASARASSSTWVNDFCMSSFRFEFRKLNVTTAYSVLKWLFSESVQEAKDSLLR